MPDRLTRAEIVCLRLAGEGLTNKEIARRLGAGKSPKTVGNQLSSAYAKLGTSDRMAAAAIAAARYPSPSQNGPIPIPTDAPAVDHPPHPVAPRVVGDKRGTVWPLMSPPRSIGFRLVAILGFAVAAAIILIGIVAVMWASIHLTRPLAPAEAPGNSNAGEAK